MPGNIDISVDISEVSEFFDALTDPDRRKKMKRKALQKGAQLIKDAIVDVTPDRPDLPSTTALPVGALKSDIEIRASSNGDAEFVSVQPGEQTNHVWGWVEYGHNMVTGGRRTEKNGKVAGNGVLTKVTGTTDSYVPAHPYWRTGTEQATDAAAEAIEASLIEDAGKEKIEDANVA